MGGVVWGERIGRKMVAGYKNKDPSALRSAEEDIYQAHLSIETNPDPISRMLITRDINVGFKGELAANKLAAKANIIT